MDKERAKEFIYYDDDNNIIYISKDVQTLIELNPRHNLIWIICCS